MAAPSSCLCACALLLFLVAARPAPAQELLYDVIYRPPDVRYLVLESPHFDVIFQEGLGEEAREMAAILEGALPETQALTGTRHPLHMPVVLNRFNDRSNGYVTPLPFRQEIEGVAIKGDILSPRFSSWLMAVGPHELTHAAHAAHRTGFGFAGLLRPFSSDLSRTVNLTAPPGITEGAAVYQESRIEPGAGRLHFSRFTMKFRAAMLSDRPWTLAQMLERPAYTRPYNRFYIGGAHLFSELAEDDGGRFFRRATSLYSRWPFFGYGGALAYGTGRPTYKIGRDFRREVRAREEARLEALGPLTRPVAVAGARGLVHRRPRWLDGTTLVAYVKGYDVRAGFYRIDVRTGARRPISYQNVTEDVYYSLSRDTTAILFARYVPDPFVPIQALADVFRLDLASGAVERLTHDARVLSPVEVAGGETWALQNDGPFNQWVRLRERGVEPVTNYARAFFKSLIPSPDGRRIAVLLNVRGHQGLFRAYFDEEGGRPRLEPWLLFESASIFEASWSPDGRYLLFSADPGGISNLYALDVRGERLLRLTNAPFGALDPALSPDGRTLAYVDYQHERYNLVTLPFAPEAAEAVPLAEATFGRCLPWEAWLNQTSADALGDLPPLSDGPPSFRGVHPYRPLARLAPRALYPVLRLDDDAFDALPGTDLGPGAGVGLQGTDPLQRWSYGGAAFYRAGRIWGEATVQTGRWLLRPQLSLYDRPYTVLSGQEGVPSAVRAGVEERGVEAGLSLPILLTQNVYQSSALLALRGIARQVRFIDERGQAEGTFSGRLTLRPSAALAYRLQANGRDLIPNTGLVLSANAYADVRADQGGLGRALVTRLDLFLPFLRASNTGLRLNAGVLTQNRNALFDLLPLLPRDQANVFSAVFFDADGGTAGTFAHYGAEAVQPLLFIDNGFVLVPLYVKVLYGYGFAEQARRLRAGGGGRTALGAGLGLQVRVLHLLDLDLRLGLAFSPETSRWSAVFR